MHDGSPAGRVPFCSICNRPVGLNEATTDEDGRAVHESCYIAKIHLVPSDRDRASAQSRSPLDAAKMKPRPEN
jgi:hypothetical protein